MVHLCTAVFVDLKKVQNTDCLNCGDPYRVRVRQWNRNVSVSRVDICSRQEKPKSAA